MAWEQWKPWVSAVVGHHGVISSHVCERNEIRQLWAEDNIKDSDKQARLEWIKFLENKFLKPEGLSCDDDPSDCSPLLAGFCSVCDWLGSNTDNGLFEYQADFTDNLDQYWNQHIPLAEEAIIRSGLYRAANPYESVQVLLDSQSRPRQLQTIVEDLPLKAGLTIIEAPTGSGKTEVALAYAWRLIEAGLAESIIFALPTQATANAMLNRLEKIAPILFGKHPNIVLAHGKAGFNEFFRSLKQAAIPSTQQGKTEAKAQCAQWLAISRKRIFLGQMGICTIDQVLISVLPIRHKFVRTLGVGKSILIIDEVHAYDRYMIGLVDEVLKIQQTVGGSAILLSATLPSIQKSDLLKAWDCTESPTPQLPYPLVTSVNSSGIDPFELPKSEPLPQFHRNQASYDITPPL